MSNKKWFGVVFLILSCCEFGQFVYSKTISTGAQTNKPGSPDSYCCEDKTLDNESVSK